ncbi:biotin/lipoyl-containing protein [Sphingomonas sp.]|uniref:ATP-binding protein n=1 Tax=Sphingomonas sp. TaxID=28214 RepID=UPI00286C67B7|nr:biotin/lipoyl-containing protein [Sphingomonas sp.]
MQVFGDTHGNIVHLFERDCSLQRRHQKVIEEAPAPGMDEATREKLCAAAMKAAKAVDYVGAGTIEFIADTSDREGGGSGLRADRIWFMEMNTRLQVEHPVTEEITGVDLVEWQLRVASGEKLPKRQDELSINGWAMEARLYAEDPTKEFLPSVGPLKRFSLNSFTSAERIETGVEEGDEISAFYDPMIAKIIGHADNRVDAADGVVGELLNLTVWPVRTNAAFLINLLRDQVFLAGQVQTGYIGQHLERLTAIEAPNEAVLNSAARALMPDTWDSAWKGTSGFRLNGQPSRVWRLADAQGQPVEFEFGDSYDPAFTDVIDGTAIHPYLGTTYAFRLHEPRGNVGAHAGDGAILAPMPGKVTSVEVAAGDAVTKGQRLLTLEAMKMEHGLVAPFDGVVAELNTHQGAQVQVDALLAKIEPDKN